MPGCGWAVAIGRHDPVSTQCLLPCLENEGIGVMIDRNASKGRRLRIHRTLVLALLTGVVANACTATAPRPRKEITNMAESPTRNAPAPPESRTLVLDVPTGLGDRPRLRFEGVRHSLRSFEVRIFLNRPEANAATPVRSEPGYATSFHMYGHGLPDEQRTGREAVIEDGARVGGQRLHAFEALVDIRRVRLALNAHNRAQITLVVVGPGQVPLPHETFQFDAVHLEP